MLDHETAPGPVVGEARDWQAGTWRCALLHATPICVFVLGLFFYWFALADRYAVFLYGHMGATPFDERTRSRYWMTGPVAAGAVLVLYTAANWLAGRVCSRPPLPYAPPAWRRVWLLLVIPLGAGIPAITMRANWPTLPPTDAAVCAAACLAGLALALAPGALAARRPTELAWLAVGGMGLLPTLMLLRAVELPARGLLNPATAWRLAGAGVLAGFIWLALLSIARAARHEAPFGILPLFISGVTLMYLLLPLIHHLFLTPSQIRYISAGSNFFAFNPAVQIVVLAVAAGQVVAAVALQHKLRARPPSALRGG